MANPYRELERSLGYRFRRRSRLELALVHPSYRCETDGVNEDNQRLEYLGDAALGLAAAAHYYAEHPSDDEGGLTHRRSAVTSTRPLAALARAIGLGAHLKLGRGELQTGGAERPSTLADTLEAVIGAAYLDRGMKAVEAIFKHLFLKPIPVPRAEAHVANPKGELQIRCQHRWKEGPRYVTVSEEGPSHARRFRVEVRLGDRLLGRGHGASKRKAETEAAREALEQVPPSRRR